MKQKYHGAYDKYGRLLLPVSVDKDGVTNTSLPELVVTPYRRNLREDVDKGRKEFVNKAIEIAEGTGLAAAIGGVAGGVVKSIATRSIKPVLNILKPVIGSAIGYKAGEKIDKANEGKTNYKIAGALLGGIVGSSFINKNKLVSKRNVDKLDRISQKELATIKGESKNLIPETNTTENLVSPEELKKRFLKFIGGSTRENINNKLSYDEDIQIGIMKDRNIDLSDISKSDILKAINLRKEELLKTAPDRFNVVIPKDNNKKRFIINDLYRDRDKIKKAGSTIIEEDKNGDFYIKMINKDGNKNNVYERGLNSAIQIANKNNKDGIVSGDKLMSSTITYKIWNKFPNKNKIRENGFHSDFFMESPEITNYKNGPVYKILEPSSLTTKTKSINFDPVILDENGKMKIDWSDLDIYKFLIPPIAYGYKNKE